MARLAAAHRALGQLYEQQAESTVDYLLTQAALMCLSCSRTFGYGDPLCGCWIMIQIWRPEHLGGQQWTLIE